MSSGVTQIADKDTHDTIVAESWASTPTVVYVSNSALPACKELTPKYEALAEEYSKRDGPQQTVKFTQLELSPETSYFFKFSPNQLPVAVLMSQGPWSRTIMSPKIKDLEDGIAEMLERGGKLRN